MYHIENYNYELPENLIAQEPVAPPHNSGLLVCRNTSSQLNFSDHIFKDLPSIVQSNNVFFFNNSKVIKAQVFLENKTIINKYNKTKYLKSGQIFFLEDHKDNRFEAMVFPGDKFTVGSDIYITSKIYARVEQITISGRILKLFGENIYNFLEDFGKIPLPPYIEDAKHKEKKYQTNFASLDGSSAAPTAGLHFTNSLINKLKENDNIFEYISLHIGIGTFKPIITEDIRDYDIHQEKAIINKDIFEKIAEYKNQGKNLIVVGTTTTRVLESLPYLREEVKNKYEFSLSSYNFRESLKKTPKNEIQNLELQEEKIIFHTKLFIYEGFEFKITKNLITNFHLPKSSLLTMVSGFMGYHNMFRAYNHAIKKKYRFFSFGDAMFICNEK